MIQRVLDAQVLTRILELALDAPHPADPLVLLRVSREFHLLALPLVYGALDTSRISSGSLFRLSLLLDPLFSQRIRDYTAQRPDSPGASFPLSPANFYRTARGPTIGRYVKSLLLHSRWNHTPDVLEGHKGVPLVFLPCFVDLVRTNLPNLRRLALDLPHLDSSHGDGKVLATDVTTRIRFGELEVLVLRGFPLDFQVIGYILASNPSLVALTLHHARIAPASFAASRFNATFAASLRRVTLHSPSLNLESIAFMLKTCLQLESLQVLDFDWPPSTLPDAARAVDAFRRRQTQTDTGIAPVKSLVLRATSRTPAIPATELPIYLALLGSLAGSLEALHVSCNLATTPFLAGVLAEDACGSLQRLWIGFGYAAQELAGSGEAEAADFQRDGARPWRREALRRDSMNEGDPLDPAIDERDEGTMKDPPVPPPEARRPAALASERAVLARIGLDERLVKSLVDPTAPTLAPGDILTSPQLEGFPELRRSLAKSRKRAPRLRSCWVFETEYVGAVRRQQLRLGELPDEGFPERDEGVVRERGVGAFEQVMQGTHLRGPDE